MIYSQKQGLRDSLKTMLNSQKLLQLNNELMMHTVE